MRRGRGKSSHRGLRLAPAAHAVPLAGAGRHRADLAGGAAASAATLPSQCNRLSRRASVDGRRPIRPGWLELPRDPLNRGPQRHTANSVSLGCVGIRRRSPAPTAKRDARVTPMLARGGPVIDVRPDRPHGRQRQSAGARPATSTSNPSPTSRLRMCARSTQKLLAVEVEQLEVDRRPAGDRLGLGEQAQHLVGHPATRVCAPISPVLNE